MDLHPEIKAGSLRLFTGIQDVCSKLPPLPLRPVLKALQVFHRKLKQRIQTHSGFTLQVLILSTATLSNKDSDSKAFGSVSLQLILLLSCLISLDESDSEMPRRKKGNTVRI